MTRPRSGADAPAAGARSVWRPLGLPIAAWLCLAALLPFVPALRDGFVFDDRGLIVENPAVQGASPAACWNAPYWPEKAAAGLYRPWTSFSFWLNDKAGGSSPAPFHAVNLLLHLAAVLLLHRVLSRLFPGRAALAGSATLLFAVHPLHSEAVVSLVGRAELWAAVFGLGAWLTAIRFADGGGAGRLVATAAAFALGMLSKESTAGLLLLPPLHAVLGKWEASPRSAGPGGKSFARRWGIVLAAWGAVLLVVLSIRARVLGSAFGLTMVSLSDNALAHEPVLSRIGNALGIQWLLVLRTVFPWTLAADASYPQIVPGGAWMGAGAVFLALCLVLAWYAWRRRDVELAWGIGLVLAAGFVTSNIPIAVGTIYGERLAYLPSAGSLWLLAVAGGRVSSRPGARRGVITLAVAWGLFLAGRSGARCLDWKDDLSLFRATTAVSPRSAKAWTNLAVALLDRDRVPEALAASGKALELLPGYPGAREARGTALTRSGRAAEAVAVLSPARRETPPRPRSLIELGNAWLSLGNGVSAESAFVAAARFLPAGDARTEIGLASSFALQKRWRDAAKTWRHAARQKPGDTAVQRSYAWSLWQAGAPDSAEVIYRELLARNPAEPSVLNELAWLLGHGGKAPDEAVTLARAAFRLQPDPDTADTLLECLRAAGRVAEARAWLDSLSLSPPPAIPVDSLRAWRERWDRKTGSGRLTDR